MPQSQRAQTSASQNVILLSDDKIIISHALLREVLGCLLLTTPIVGQPRPPEHHWSAIKSMRLYRAKKLIRQALLDGNSQRGDV
ncbi:hypothetical protein Q5692_37230 [Microcoleus sp. C2C3]|uniref:hypothetical protein n=1 Tax=unclassified Microcoleus TaxID=2642155 RepID=UPI002FD017DF